MELPRLQELWETHGDEGVEMVAIESSRKTEQAVDFIEEAGLGFVCVENGVDDGEVVQGVFRIQGYPTTWVVDRNGRVMYRHYGWEDGEEKEIEHEILTLL